MTNNKQDWHHQIQSEADEHLFYDLQFDDQMKQQVLHKLSENKQGSGPIFARWNLRSMHSRSMHSRPMYKRSMHKWGMGVAATAMVIGFILLGQFLFDEKDNMNLPNHLAIEFAESGTDAAVFSTPVTEDTAEIDKGFTTANDPLNGPMLLESVEQAAEKFGEPILVPSYLPDSYELANIMLTSEQSGNAPQVTLQYLMKTNESSEVITTFSDTLAMVELTQSKQDHAVTVDQAKIVDINGVNGYMTIQNKNTGNKIAEFVDLQWFVHGVQYSLSGTISEEDALKTAKSLVTIDEKLKN